MPIRESVFGSKREQALFQKLKSRWHGKYDIWPSLPILNIVTPLRERLSSKEWEALKKMSVDFTLCEKDASPILSIEFDGLGKGFSRGSQYVQVEQTRAAYRKLKLDLKLRVAAEQDYPFFVISSQECAVVDARTQLLIVDGIIGQVLALRELRARMQGHSSWVQGILDDPLLNKEEKHERVQDWVTDVEVEAEAANDPIVAERMRLGAIARERGLLIKGWKAMWLEDPPAPTYDWTKNDRAAFTRRVAALDNAERIGCTFRLETAAGDVEKTVWVRNVRTAGVFPLTLAENIARLLATKEALKRFPGNRVLRT